MFRTLLVALSLLASAPCAFAATSGGPVCGWTTLMPEIDPTGGAAPLGRVLHTAIVDAPRQRLVIYGGDALVGDSIHTQSDAWALSLAGPPAWSEITPIGTAPEKRRQHTAIYDAPRERMIVFGGLAFDDARARYWPDDSASVWSLSLNGMPAWTLLPTRGSTMTRRYAHAAVHDPVRQRMWVYGGADLVPGFRLSARLDYVSLENPDEWTTVTPAGSAPPALAEHVMVYDSSRDRILLWGGIRSNGSAHTDLYELALSPTPAWTKLEPIGTPPPTTVNIRAVYDPVGDQMIIDGPEATYALTLTNGPSWRPARPHSLRLTPAVAYDSTGARVLAMGGEDVVVDFNSVQQMPPPPTVRWSANPEEAGGVQIEYHGDCPETATLTALPNHGWDFAGWSGDVTGSDSVLTLALGGGKTVVANFAPSTATLVSRFEAKALERGVELRWSFGDPSRVVSKVIERRHDIDIEWQRLDLPIHVETHDEVAVDASIAAGASEFIYRLRVLLVGGEEIVVGPVRPEALDAVRGSGIESIAPNPAFARTTITFALAADARARLSVLDVAGREVTRLVHGFQPHGRYQVSWDGTAAGRRLPHGLYFVRLTVDGRDVVRRLVLSQ